MIWGTGKYSDIFLSYNQPILSYVCGFVESDKSKNIYYGKPVYTPKEIKNKKYDYLIVASQFISEIKAKIYMTGLSLENTVFLKNTWIPFEINNNKLYLLLNKCQSQPTQNAIFFAENGFFSTTKEAIDIIQRKETSDYYWKDKHNYDTWTNLPNIYFSQKKFLEDTLIPKLKKTDTIFDIACASGEWSRFLSRHVKQIDGYDISPNMIEMARKVSIDWGFKNTNFICREVSSIELNKLYDHGLILGLTTCIDNENKITHLLEKIKNSIKKRGLVIVRDTLSMYTDYNIYLHIKQEDSNPDYFATYRPIKKYISFFEENGFKLKEESYFSIFLHEPVELGSHGLVFQKI